MRKLIFKCHENPLLLFLLLSSVTSVLSSIDPMVDTKVGLIRGLQAQDGNYSMFLGIPYAKVNESNPFGPSIAFPKFENIFEAIHECSICPQSIQNAIIGNLDCLELNIYVPHTANSKNLTPVLVWFHGGSFYTGSSRRDLYGAKFLVRYDVILVTVNYRLGPYGFMCLGTHEVPGNQGLKDQLIALRWVNNNIKAFGGNANKVTLFGESAGGRSVDFHLISDQEKLFDKVILQSGNSICPPVIAEVDRRPPLMLAEKMGFLTNNASEALNYLAKADPKSVIAASSKIDYIFRPCVEKDFTNVEKFVSNYTFFKKIPKVKNTPILVGYNNNEKIIPYVNLDVSYLKNLKTFENIIDTYFDFNKQHLNEMVQMVRQFYIGGKKTSTELMQALADFDSDFTYLHPTHRRTYQNVLNGAQIIYHYIFSYNGQRNMAQKKSNITINGAAHSDELGYLFDMKLLSNEPSKDDQLIIDRMTTLWTNFAKFGDPTPSKTELLPVKWKPITENNMYYYKIDRGLSLESWPHNKRMAFWDLFFKLNEKLQKGF